MENCKTVYSHRISVCLSDELYESVKQYMNDNDLDSMSLALRNIIKNYFKNWKRR